MDKPIVISNSTLESGAYDELSGLRRIRIVSLLGCNVTDAELIALAQNKYIELLGLEGTSITDRGLKSLSEMKNLTDLRLVDSKCTWDGIRKLCEDLRLQSLETNVGEQPDTDSWPAPTVTYTSDMIRETILGEPATEKNTPSEIGLK